MLPTSSPLFLLNLLFLQYSIRESSQVFQVVAFVGNDFEKHDLVLDLKHFERAVFCTDSNWDLTCKEQLR